MQFYDVAKILTTHGLNGEVKVALITDFPQKRFASGVKLVLKESPEKILTIEYGRPFKQFWLVKFKEISSIKQAKKLQGKILVVNKNDQQSLPVGTYYYHDILNCLVVDNFTKKIMGKIIDIQSLGPNDVWLVKDKKQEYWIPYIKEVVKKVDVANKKIYVELMEGLRDEN